VIWRRLTVLLVTLSAALPVWIYLRDKGTYIPQRSESIQAELDARRILGVLAPSRAGPVAARSRYSVEMERGCGGCGCAPPPGVAVFS
jgi:hypothetical protein